MTDGTTGAGTGSMSWSWRREAPMIAIIVAMFIASAIAWPRVEEPIPIHWNASGEVDGTGGRFEGLLMLPAISVGLYLLLTFLPRLDPARANYGLFAGSYGLIRLVFLLFMAAVHAMVIAAAFGRQVDMLLVMPLGLAALFIVLGNVMGKVRPNYFAGVRTPWTLTSVKSWNATHRVAGWVFIVSGLAFLGMAVVREGWYLVAVLIAFGVALVGVMAYSWWVWRGDEDRVSATGTRPAED